MVLPESALERKASGSKRRMALLLFIRDPPLSSHCGRQAAFMEYELRKRLRTRRPSSISATARPPGAFRQLGGRAGPGRFEPHDRRFAEPAIAETRRHPAWNCTPGPAQ